MTATTPRYDLTYPTGTDQVNDTPTIYKNMADSIENALATVDDRQTGEAVKPVVRTTLDQLVEASAVDGQSGLVTEAGQSQGLYYRLGGQWIPLAPRAKRQWSGTFTRSDGKLLINTGETAMIATKTDGTNDITIQSIGGGSLIKLPAGRWLASALIQFSGVTNAWLSLYFNTKGGTKALTVNSTEIAHNGNNYNSIGLTTLFDSPGGDSDGIQIALNSTQSGTMRIKAILRIAEL